MPKTACPITFVVGGNVRAPLLALSAPLSFWGGIDIMTGEICDVTHPERGASITGRVLLLPATKGSTAGPGALLECLFAPSAPAAILTFGPDIVVTIASRMQARLGGPCTPVGHLSDVDFARCTAFVDGTSGELSANGALTVWTD